MVFLTWVRPTTQDQKNCLNKSGTFNYDDKYKGVTAKSLSSLKEDKGFSKDGFLLNNARVLVGTGIDTFEKGKSALQSWRHFGLNWAFVDPKTPVRQGAKFCVCVKEFLPWLMMPLQVVYVNETRTAKNRVTSFGFGGGTLQGHLLVTVFSLILLILFYSSLYCVWLKFEGIPQINEFDYANKQPCGISAHICHVLFCSHSLYLFLTGDFLCEKAKKTPS